MRKLLALARRPVVWLSVIAIAFWLIVLRAVVPPPPEYVIAIGEVEYHGRMDWDRGRWTELNDVADDGSTVTYTVIDCPGKMYTAADTHPHIRNTRDGEDVTPARWADINGESPPAWQLVWHSELWHHPEGRAFVYDEEAWAKLKARFPSVFGGDPTASRWHQPHFQISPDGRLVAFESRDGELNVRGEAEGTTIQETRTGQRVAFLRGETGQIYLAPGGQTAVTELKSKEKDGEHPRLAVWDLATSSVRMKLSLPTDSHIVTFSPDGRYVFAEYYSWVEGSAWGIRWWDTFTGRQVGQIDGARAPLLTTGGRVLVTRQKTPKRPGEAVFQFWDVESGESLGEATLGVRIESGLYLLESDCIRDRQLLFEFVPDSGRHHDWLGWHAKELYQTITGHKPPDPTQVMVWDTVERREVLRVPGKRPALSANGRWLATLDEDGVIRVWDVNAPAPWTHALGYAIAAGLGTVIGAVLGLRFVRWCWKGRRRRGWAITLAVVVLLMVVAYKCDMAAADRADAEFIAVYHHLHSRRDITESEVTALFGRPPDRVTTLPAENEKGARTRLTWIGWWDQKCEMEFDSDGKAGDRSTSGGRSFVEWIAGGCRD